MAGRLVGTLRRPAALSAVYLLAVFLGALLMFWMELLIGKKVLPMLGGAPMVWTTCMVFFQALLLAGYAYAHWSRRFGSLRQGMIHLGLIALSLLALPIGGGQEWLPPNVDDPRPWLIAWLLMGIGGPFFVLSATGPLLQSWFAASRHPEAANPYFLYATSNAGSLVGLLGFLVLAEFFLTLTVQSFLWSAAYLAFAGLTAIGWAASLQSPSLGDFPLRILAHNAVPSDAVPTKDQRLRWVLLAFVPSSLLLGVTHFIATDIAAVPLVWMVPLAFYLVTFMVVFAKRPPLRHDWIMAAQPVAVLPPVLLWFWQIGGAVNWMIGVHLAAFILIALACHGELARSRPSSRHLTEFYLFLALGGALGGMFNSIVAPVIFASLFEYPLVMVLSLFVLLPVGAGEGGRKREDVVVALAWLLVLLAFFEFVITRRQPGEHESQIVSFSCVLFAMLCLAARHRPLRYALMVAAFLVVSKAVPLHRVEVQFAERNFFGVVKVVDEMTDGLRYFYHGTTRHGAQYLDPEKRLIPTAYYGEGSPIAQIFRLPSIDRADAHVAVLGLGAGTISCLARQGQRLVFFEINPAVIAVAENPNLFTFVRDCPARTSIVQGDGRQMPAREAARSFDLIVLDAFSSDAIPVHLMTREALAMYRSILKDGGVIAYHVSNRYLDLSEVLAVLARDAGLEAFSQYYFPVTGEEGGEMPSHWVALTAEGAGADAFSATGTWERLVAEPGAPVWTDAYSNLLRVLQ